MANLQGIYSGQKFSYFHFHNSLAGLFNEPKNDTSSSLSYGFVSF